MSCENSSTSHSPINPNPELATRPLTHTTGRPVVSTPPSSHPESAYAFVEDASNARPTMSRHSTSSVESSQPTHDLSVGPVNNVLVELTRQAPSANTQPLPSLTTVPNPWSSSLSRDALLAYAHHLYSNQGRTLPGLTSVPIFNALPTHTSPEQVYRLRLLPLLTTLRSLHPNDLAILLLLSCTYHVLGEYDTCLRISQDMLRINPDYAEAMNNIGTTMSVLGRNDQAYEYWWKAIQLQPTYWDAIDNLLGFLFTLAHKAIDANQRSILYARAQDVCTLVRRKVLDGNGRLLLPVAAQDLPRLQKVLLTSGTILAMHPSLATSAVTTYFQAIELVLSPLIELPPSTRPTTRDLILASFLAMYILQPPDDDHLPVGLSRSLGLPDDVSCSFLLDSEIDLFSTVRNSGDRMLHEILRLGGGALPFMLLAPEQAVRLLSVLLPSSAGVLPAICMQDEDGRLHPPAEAKGRDVNVMTGTIMLALAKRYQELSSNQVAIPGFDGTLNVNHSLSILFYYLALALSPSPSTYNNMGIVLSTISSTSPYTDPRGEQLIVSGTSLARLYYTSGLELDPNHPHLLTNLGSLHKDQGDLDEAIKLYSKALAIKPDFDVALANMGNAVKDTGRTWEALDYYRKAVELNPDLPEAVCGLVNAMSSVCDWRGRTCYTDEYGVDEQGNLLEPTSSEHLPRPGLMHRMLEICEKQLALAYSENVHAFRASRSVDDWLHYLEMAFGRAFREDEYSGWQTLFSQFHLPLDRSGQYINEGGFVIRLCNWIQARLQRQWYAKVYGRMLTSDYEVVVDSSHLSGKFLRPTLPRTMAPPAVPSLLPFNTFMYPLSARISRLISHRNALRISFTAMSQPWLPPHVYPPPPPPVGEVLNIAYVSNDVNNHPLSHLMQSVFGLHDRTRFRVFLYTTSPWDGTSYRPRISSSVEVFVDASTWSSEQIVRHILSHKIHILINLGGYTKGARNDVFAARACPVQIQLIGYAGTLGAGWCDYLVSDPIASPQDLCGAEVWRRKRAEGIFKDPRRLDLDADPDPEDPGEEWIYSEKMIYMPYTFMVTDHKQSFRTDEELTPEERAQVPVDVLWRDEEMRRQEMRKAVFPDLSQDVVIFANFNQLYKIDPGIFAIWLRILNRVPNSILWLLRFPAAGEEHIMRTARNWAGDAVAARIRFTDVATKEVHINRGRVADLFLDTVEVRVIFVGEKEHSMQHRAQCNAHTIAGDIIWSGTPFVTFPKHRHKMCSRVAASMANGTGFGEEMVVSSLQDYEGRAVALANGIQYIPETSRSGAVLLRGQGELLKLRRNLFLNRDRMPLFDTIRWTRNIEKGYREAWRRWVEGTQFEMSDEWEACQGPEKESGCIWVQDNDPVEVIRYD